MSLRIYPRVLIDLWINALLNFKECTKIKRKEKKSEGDGFMDDYYCHNFFACSFHFRKMSPPIKCMRLNLSTLNSRVLVLFDTLPNINHKWWVENMHDSVKFVVQSLKCKAHAMLGGV